LESQRCIICGERIPAQSLGERIRWLVENSLLHTLAQKLKYPGSLVVCGLSPAERHKALEEIEGILEFLNAEWLRKEYREFAEKYSSRSRSVENILHSRGLKFKSLRRFGVDTRMVTEPCIFLSTTGVLSSVSAWYYIPVGRKPFDAERTTHVVGIAKTPENGAWLDGLMLPLFNRGLVVMETRSVMILRTRRDDGFWDGVKASLSRLKWVGSFSYQPVAKVVAVPLSDEVVEEIDETVEYQMVRRALRG